MSAEINMNRNQKEIFDPIEKVTGVVERVTFQSPDSGFCVLKIKAEGHADLVTVVGTSPEIHPGEWVTARGLWVQDEKWGRQLKADELRAAAPETLEGMRRYLGSGLVPGIGPGFADRLIDAFGKDVFTVIETEPKRLREVPGIGAGRVKLITEGWAEQRHVRDIMVFLQGHGVSTNRAFRIYKQYGQESIRLIQEDPYRLARDLHGIGFKLADQVAANLEVAPDSPLRLAAGVEHVLGELNGQGHTAYPQAELVAKVSELLEASPEKVDRAVTQALKSGRLAALDTGPEAVPHVALAPVFRAEKQLAQVLRQLGEGPPPAWVKDPQEALQWVQKATELELAEGQKAAVLKALTSKLLIITGGPGVGKTTLLNSILKIHQARKKKVVACAPTGRAARRLAETTGVEAKTIHRLLVFNPATGGFRHDRSNPLAGDVFVVDEFSMVDTILAWQLLSALPPGAVLLLVGDRDQLPSVGPGRVLADAIASGRLPVAVLDEVFRQAAQSAIVTNAHRINRGLMPEVSHAGRDHLEDFYFIAREDPEEIADLVVDLVAHRLPRRLKVDPVADIQVLTPMRRGNLGTANLNLRLQAALNPQGQQVMRAGVTWRVGDRVMQTVNNYDKDVFNGDAGLIIGLDPGDQEIHVRFEERQATYAYAELDELIHAYAATIHKSQGSEYPVVVMPLHTQQYMLLQRNLLYTGVTRGRQLVVLVGSSRALKRAVHNSEAGQRVTLLGHWLQAGSG
jgi:exodeoxyribonuclease V alpha subunit